jgi:hypothetical protein
VLGWVLTFPVLFLVRYVPRWRSWLLAWLGLCAICATAYFWGYQKPPSLPAFAPSAGVREYAGFILEFLGGALAYAWKDRPSVSATLFGAEQCILFFALLAYCARRIRDRAFIVKIVPWIALGSYSFGSAFLAALGRVGYGAHYALASRYVTFSIYLAIAVIALVAIVGRQLVSSSSPMRLRAWTCAVFALLVIGYLVPSKVCAFNTTFFLRSLSARDRLARAAVLLNRVIDTSEIIKKTAYPNDARPVIEGADALDRLKLLRPPLLRTNRLEAIPHEIADGIHAAGACETFAAKDGQFVRASGWAVLNAKGRPPDSVAIAYQTAPDQEWILCAISDSIEMRPEIVKRFKTIDQLWSGWSATFPRNVFPANARLSFWALDADAPKLYRLTDETVSIPR